MAYNIIDQLNIMLIFKKITEGNVKILLGLYYKTHNYKLIPLSVWYS